MESMNQFQIVNEDFLIDSFSERVIFEEDGTGDPSTNPGWGCFYLPLVPMEKSLNHLFDAQFW